MNNSTVPFMLLSWNVRRLGDPDKCKVVRDTLASSLLDVACLQESKLCTTDPAKARTFLPRHLADFVCVDATATRGGLVTAWNNHMLLMTSFIRRQRTLTTVFFHGFRHVFHGDERLCSCRPSRFCWFPRGP
ncbi:unnamed protein product [Urochloa humidicola]